MPSVNSLLPLLTPTPLYLSDFYALGFAVFYQSSLPQPSSPSSPQPSAPFFLLLPPLLLDLAPTDFDFLGFAAVFLVLLDVDASSPQSSPQPSSVDALFFGFDARGALC